MTGSSTPSARDGARRDEPRTAPSVAHPVRRPPLPPRRSTRPGSGFVPQRGQQPTPWAPRAPRAAWSPWAAWGPWGPRAAWSRWAPWASRQAGSATVELAAVIPLLVVMTLAMVGLVGIARDQVLAQGAAREGAREAALGGDPARAVAAARAALPGNRPARVGVASAGAGRVRVEVELPARLPFGAPMVTVRAVAVALLEPGPPPSPAGP